MQQKLLTIAIPTFNRASILELALSKLLPQINRCKDEIELIISDNASIDNTQEVISLFQEKYSEINFITYLQPENTGYFGNFKKCKELSNGKYFWLLSDNEHISANFITFLIDNIKQSKINVGTYFLSQINQVHYDRIQHVSDSYSIADTDLNFLITNYTAYRLTLISSVIFINDKKYDEDAVNELHNNLFIGFIYLCNALRINNNIRIINGNIYETFPCNVSFDPFKAFTKDIMECVHYLQKYELLNEEQKHQFVTGYLQTNIKYYVSNFIMNSSILCKKCVTIKKIKKLLDSYYMDYYCYKIQILPLFDQSKIIHLKYQRFVSNPLNRLIHFIINR